MSFGPRLLAESLNPNQLTLLCYTAIPFESPLSSPTASSPPLGRCSTATSPTFTSTPTSTEGRIVESEFVYPSSSPRIHPD